MKPHRIIVIGALSIYASDAVSCVSQMRPSGPVNRYDGQPPCALPVIQISFLFLVIPVIIQEFKLELVFVRHKILRLPPGRLLILCRSVSLRPLALSRRTLLALWRTGRSCPLGCGTLLALGSLGLLALSSRGPCSLGCGTLLALGSLSLLALSSPGSCSLRCSRRPASRRSLPLRFLALGSSRRSASLRPLALGCSCPRSRSRSAALFLSSRRLHHFLSAALRTCSPAL